MTENIKGKVHSFQSLGTVDGPGIRFVVFMQGCNLRCGCCHNPDTWDFNAGTEYTPSEVVKRVCNYKDYFGKDGGITISGGEPLLQSDFCYEVFKLCHTCGINTCLDTSGSILNESIKKLLTQTDRVLLDIKYTEDILYEKYVGCKYSKVLEFLNYLDVVSIPVTLRQVIIPGLNDNKENISVLSEISKKYPCVDRTELLPFRKMCQVKYDNMNLEFPFKYISEPSFEKMVQLNTLLNI